MNTASNLTAVTAADAVLPLPGALSDIAERIAQGERAGQSGRGLLAHYLGPEGAALDEDGEAAAGWPAKDRDSKKRARYLKRMGTLAVSLGKRVVTGVVDDDARLAVFTALSGIKAHWNDVMPALSGQDPDGERSWERGFSRLPPLWMLSHLSNNVHGELSIALSATCDGATFGGETAGAQALTSARRSLLLGHCDRALVVAYDSWLCPEKVASLIAHNAPPYPVFGEAVVALVLQRANDADGRARYLIDADASGDAETSLRRVRTRLDLGNDVAVDDAVLTALGESGAPSALVQGAVLGAQCAAAAGHGSVAARLATGVGTPRLCWAVGVRTP